MINFNVIYRTKEDLLTAKKKTASYTCENVLIQAFSGIADASVISQLQADLRDVFPGTPVIGATTGGEIINSKVQDETIVLCFSFFTCTKIRSHIVPQNDNPDAAAFSSSRPKVIIAFGTGLKSGKYTSDVLFLAALNKKIKNVVLAGGQAGTEIYGSRTYVFNESVIAENGYGSVIAMLLHRLTVCRI